MDSVAYHGEMIWTDGRGFATVSLPAEAEPPEPPLEYELRDLEPPSGARITAGPRDGRFTIATDQPHVWRLKCRRQPESDSRQHADPGQPHKEEK